MEKISNGLATREMSDAELVQMYRQGDKKAFEKLLANNKKLLLGTAKFFGIYKRYREDVYQEWSLLALEDITRPGAKDTSWVLKLAEKAVARVQDLLFAPDKETRSFT